MNRMAIAAGLLALGFLSGCKTLETLVEPKAMSDKDLAQVFSEGRDPAEFFIHRFRNETGETVFTGYNRQPQSARAVLLFESPAHSILPLIRARVPEGAEFLVLADTACRQNWTSLELRETLGLVPVGPDRVGAIPAHVLDETPGYLCILPQVEFDRLGVEAVLIYGRAGRKSFWPMPRHADARAAQAVMGMDLLRSFAFVTWDYANRMMELSSTDTFEPSAERVLAELPISFEPETGALMISCVVDTREESVIFDSAGNYDLAMVDPSLEPVRQLGLQDLVFRRVLAVTPQSVGLVAGETVYLGAALLRRYRVTLDNRRNVLWIEGTADSGTPAEPHAKEPAGD